MAGRSVDVSLNIKAQDQASKALDAVGKALKDLAGAQTALAGGSSGVGKFVESLSTNVDGLSTLFKKLDTTLASTGRAYETQTRQLASVNTSITDRKRRIQELIKVETDLQRIQGTYKSVSPAKQATFVGPVPPRLTQVRSQLGTENTALAKEEAALERLITKSAEARDANQQIRTAQAQVATALNTTTNAFLEQANALDRLSAAEKRAATEALSRRQNQALEARVAAVTGTNRTGTPASLRPQRQADLEAAFAPAFAKEDTAAIKEAEQAYAAFETRAKAGAAAMQQVQKYARDVSEALDPVARVTRMVAEEQQRLAEAVKLGALSQGQAADALLRYKNNLDGTNAATERQSAEYRELDTYVQELRRDFDRAAYSQAFLERETAKLDRARKTLNTTTGKAILDEREYAKALETVKRKAEQLGEQSNPQLFGLNPYQTQNLMFQFNDIATQLASGTSLTQTLSQQGGQILQLFPKVGNSIVGAFSQAKGAILPVGLAIGAVVLALKSAGDQAERLRSIGGLLAGIGTEGSSSVAELSAAAKALDVYGVSAEDAIAITRKLTREGFDATRIEAFGKTAKDISDVLGIDLNQAVTLLTDAYGGNIESLRRLMDETDAFTPAQREMIEALYSGGDAAGALDKAFAILSKNMNEGATQARGPWANAFRELGNSWSELVEQLGNTYWAKDALQGVNDLADALAWLAGKSEEAKRAERERQGIYGMAPDPLAGYAAGSPTVVGAAAARVNAGTTEQQNNAARLTVEAQRQLTLAKEITSQKDIQAKLDVFAAQEREKLGDTVTKQKQDELVAIAVKTKRVELEKQLATYQKQQTAEAERQAKLRMTTDFQAKQLLRDVEGFKPKAYWDVNAYRVGFGSDTVTREDGTTKRVTANTTVDRAGAERDLSRRIKEFADVVKQQIGSDRFGQFGPEQQAALVSIAYNYGELPKRIIGAVKSGTPQAIAAAVKGLRNDNNGVNAKRRDREAAILGTENLAVDQGARQAIDDTADAQDKFNDALDAENAARTRNYESQKALLGLQGEVLINEQRRQAILDAIADKEAEIKRTNEERIRDNKAPIAELSDAQRREIATSAGQLFDLQIPQVQFDTLKKQLADLEAYKSTLQENLQQAAIENDSGGMRAIQDQIDGVDERLKTASQSLLDFLSTPGNADALGLYGVELDNMLAKMTQLAEKTAEWKFTIGSATVSASEFANAFTSTAVSAIDQFAQAIASGKNAFSSLWDGFRQFAADFLLQIAKMIQQQIIFNLVSGLLKGLLGAAGAGFGSASQINTSTLASLRGTVLHEGGIVGGPAPFRSVSPAMFANAARYHSGGIAGLKPNEVPAVLMRGEEVLTRDDPRHMLNSGGGGGSVKIVNTFDESDFFSKGASTKVGEKAILNLVRSNPRAFKQAMNGG